MEYKNHSELINLIKECYASTSNEILCKELKISYSQLRKIAQNLELHKVLLRKKTLY